MSDYEKLSAAHDQAFWSHYGAREVLRGLPAAAQNQAQPVLEQLAAEKKATQDALFAFPATDAFPRL